MVRAIVFDLDGTLVDSLDDIAVALDGALADHGLPPPGRDLIRSWVGGGARSLIAHAVDAARVDGVLARFRAHYAAAPASHTQIYPGLPAVLDELVAAGVALAILTNKPQALTEPICERVLGRWPFAPIVGERAGVPLKPDPTAALAIARALGLAPSEIALVGDATTDIATARAAGMRPVAVTWGYRPRAELAAAGPALLLDAPAQLRTLASPGQW